MKVLNLVVVRSVFIAVFTAQYLECVGIAYSTLKKAGQVCTHDEVKELIFFFKCVVCPGVFLHKGFIAKNMYQLAKGKSSFQMNNK